MFDFEVPILGQKDFLIIEQMTMLNGYAWWSGQALANIYWALHNLQPVWTALHHALT